MPKAAPTSDTRKAYEKIVREYFPADAMTLLLSDRDGIDRRLNEQETDDLLRRFAH